MYCGLSKVRPSRKTGQKETSKIDELIMSARDKINTEELIKATQDKINETIQKFIVESTLFEFEVVVDIVHESQIDGSCILVSVNTKITVNK